MTNNYEAINQYLDDLGIDARRILTDSVTAEGYTLLPDKIRYGTDAVNPIGSQFNVPWPNPEVYKNVVLLMNGATLDEILPPEEKPKAEPKPKPTPVAKLSPELEAALGEVVENGEKLKIALKKVATKK